MKLFIRWSGLASNAVVKAFRDWIPGVINDVEPWMSEEDVAKGAHWPTRLGQELNDAKFGLICLTPQNLDQPWLLFEAGVLSKQIEQTKVCPYLFRLEKSDVKPLGHFQAALAIENDTLKLVHASMRP